MDSPRRAPAPLLRRLRRLLPLAFLPLLPAALPAQLVGGDWPTRFLIDGIEAGGELGGEVAFVPDVDGDGLPDLAVGSPKADVGGLVDAGTVDLRSGIDGHLLLHLDGPTAGALFGVALAGLQDLDGDGRGDLLVGAPYDDPNGISAAGSAYVLSGVTGALIWRIDGDKVEEKMGSSVAALGDIDGDGLEDMVIGSHAAWAGNIRKAGLAIAVSGGTGSLLHSFHGPHYNAHFGFSVAGPGDLDGDGVPDIVVGGYGVETYGINNAGAVVAYSGTTGAEIWRYDGLRKRAHRGEQLAPAGDVNGDGVPDILDGSPRSEGKPYALYAGSIAVHSGVDGSIFMEIRGQNDLDVLGAAVAPAGDLDGDGLADFMAGSPGEDPNGKLDAGTVFFYAGADGSVLARIDANGQGDRLGWSLAGAVDGDGDGSLDHLFGAPGHAIGGLGPDAGRMFQVSYRRGLALSAGSVSAGAGGRVDFAIDFPLEEAGRPYSVLMSRTGTGPTVLNGVTIPLTEDSLYYQTLQGGYPGYFTGALGTLDPAGHAMAVLDAPPGALAAFVGRTVWSSAVSYWPSGAARRCTAVAALEILP